MRSSSPPASVHATSPLTSNPNAHDAHDDELGCHRLAAGGGFGRPTRSTSFISSNKSLLRDISGVAASAFSGFIPAGFFQ